MKKLLIIMLGILLGMCGALAMVPGLGLRGALIETCTAYGCNPGPGSEPGGDLPPLGGNCRRVGVSYPDNPFHGWPVSQKVCHWESISSYFCDPDYFPGHTHWGIDISYPGVGGDEALVTAADAIVEKVSEDGKWNSGMGNYVKLQALECREYTEYFCCIGGDCEPIEELYCDYSNCLGDCQEETFEECEETEWRSIYMHLQAATVQEGQRVERGDVVGLIDSSGNSTGPHLHYQINSPLDQPGGAVDPQPTMCD